MHPRKQQDNVNGLRVYIVRRPRATFRAAEFERRFVIRPRDTYYLADRIGGGCARFARLDELTRLTESPRVRAGALFRYVGFPSEINLSLVVMKIDTEGRASNRTSGVFPHDRQATRISLGEQGESRPPCNFHRISDDIFCPFE